MKPLIAQHSSKSSLWMTPQPLIETTRAFFGGSIILDAASDEEANKRVKAFQILTDALSPAPWPRSDNAFLNPPGGKQDKDSLPKLFWKRLVEEVKSDRIGHAIFLAFSIEALQTCQDKGTCMLSYPICIPSQRLHFVSRWDPSVKSDVEFRFEILNVAAEANEFLGRRLATASETEQREWLKGARKAKVDSPLVDLLGERFAASPTHANAIVYVPGRINQTEDFKYYFRKHGAVKL